MESYFGTISCFTFSVFMLTISIFFALGKEKAARFISGFSSYPKEKRVLYNQRLMSKDMAILYFQLAMIMVIGSIVSFINQYLCIGAFIAWILLFFKNVHLDEDKAFAKYKK